MTQFLGMKSWAAGALVLVAVTACTNSDPEPAPPDASSSTTSSASSPTPTSPSEVAAADATRLIERYFSVLDKVRMEPATPLSELRTVAIGIQLGAQTNLIRREREKDRHQVGVTEIVELKIQSVNLDNSAPNAGRVPVVQIDVCWDVSNADVVDASGKSVTDPDLPNRGWSRYMVANYRYATAPSDGWRVASGQDLEQAPCADS